MFKDSNKLSLMLDFGEEIPYNPQIFQSIQKLNDIHFPNFLKDLFVIKMDLEPLLRDQVACQKLKAVWGDTLNIAVGEDQMETIFQKIDRNSVSQAYGGNREFVEEFKSFDFNFKQVEKNLREKLNLDM